MKLKNIFTFLFFWLCIGFTLGTILLLGPIRWMVNYIREQQLGEAIEDISVVVVILLLAVGSAVLARIQTNKIDQSSSSKFSKLFRISLAVLGFSISLALMMSPDVVNSSTQESQEEIGEAFIIGPYPTANKIQFLKSKGVNKVICLLSPLVTPFEPLLIQKEQELLKGTGIDFISIPMLPWISGNDDAVKMLDSIAKNPSGKYYIHCYLGKDRVNVAKKIIAQHGNKLSDELSEDARELNEIETFERGPIHQIEDDIYFIPLPTDEELMGYLVAGNTAQVICLMDNSSKESNELINKLQSTLETYKIKMEHIPLPETLSEQLIKEKLEKVQLTKGKNIFITFKTGTDFSNRIEKVLNNLYAELND